MKRHMLFLSIITCFYSLLIIIAIAKENHQSVDIDFHDTYFNQKANKLNKRTASNSPLNINNFDGVTIPEYTGPKHSNSIKKGMDSSIFLDDPMSCCSKFNHTLACTIIKNTTTTCTNSSEIAEHDFTVIFNLKENILCQLKREKLLQGQKPSIQSLNLSSNLVFDIENGAFDNFDSLQKLNLSNNGLTIVDDKVFTRKLGMSLEYLDLSKNLLQAVPSLRFLRNLKQLLLSSNKQIDFTSFKFPSSMANLTVLSMANCHIQSMTNDIFDNLNSLEKLVLNGNSLTSIPLSIKAIPSLILLSLTDTHIKVINDCDFCGLQNLQELLLDKNYKLCSIDENAFGFKTNTYYSSKLKMLSISYTNISTLPQNLLEWQKLEFISVEAVPFVCDCSNAWFINDLICPCCSLLAEKIRGVEKQIISQYTYCYYPVELRWTPFYNLPSKKPDFCKQS